MSGICEEDQKDIQASAHSTELGPYSLGLHSGPALGTNSHFWNLYEVNQLGLIVPNVKGARRASRPGEVCCSVPCFQAESILSSLTQCQPLLPTVSHDTAASPVTREPSLHLPSEDPCTWLAFPLSCVLYRFPTPLFLPLFLPPLSFPLYLSKANSVPQRLACLRGYTVH